MHVHCPGQTTIHFLKGIGSAARDGHTCIVLYGAPVPMVMVVTKHCMPLTWASPNEAYRVLTWTGEANHDHSCASKLVLHTL